MTDESDFLKQRALIFAKYFLTSKRNVKVASPSFDYGVDLIAVIPHEQEEKLLPVCGVQVKGVSEYLATEKEATEYANKHFREKHNPIVFFPTVLFLVNTGIPQEHGYWSWILRPMTREGYPGLAVMEEFDMMRLIFSSVSHFLNESQVWTQQVSQYLLAEGGKATRVGLSGDRPSPQRQT